MEPSEFVSESGLRLKKRKAALHDLGFSANYSEVWNLQKQLVEERIASEIPDTLLLVEHDHVLTLGRSAHIENVLVKDLPAFEIERGGDVTYHGPGQLVAYPIVNLQELGVSVRQYVELLEQVLVDTLKTLDIHAQGQLGKMTGVWVEGVKKIASIGIATSHWVTYHGLALNVNTDLSYFARINPCGFSASVMTSAAKELNRSVDMNAVKRTAVRSFSDRFGFEFETVY